MTPREKRKAMTRRMELVFAMACAHPTVSQYARHCFYEWKRLHDGMRFVRAMNQASWLLPSIDIPYDRKPDA